MAVAMNFFIPKVEEFFETILSLFNQSNGCLELRDGDQVEFLLRGLEQYEQTSRVTYQRLTETSGNNCLRPHLYGLGYPRQLFPRVSLAEVSFSLSLCKSNQPFTLGSRSCLGGRDNSGERVVSPRQVG